jgi:hypothetical protein
MAWFAGESGMIKYSPDNENSTVERIAFVKDNKTIFLVNRFDTYSVFVDEDDDDYDLADYDGTEMDTSVLGWVDEEEGERIEFAVEGDLSEEEKDELIDAFQNKYESGLEELGWTWSDRDVYFYGPVSREED